MPSILYLADRGTPAFRAAQSAVDVVCAGDSITGMGRGFGTPPACHSGRVGEIL
jgi:hypothetical protein